MYSIHPYCNENKQALKEFPSMVITNMLKPLNQHNKRDSLTGLIFRPIFLVDVEFVGILSNAFPINEAKIEQVNMKS